MKVVVDRKVCIGSGMCVGSAPEQFELDSARQSHPRAEVMDGTSLVWDAAEGCPVEAISLYDADSGKELFPGD